MSGLQVAFIGWLLMASVFWIAFQVVPFISDYLKTNWDYDNLIRTLVDGDMFELLDDHTIQAGNLRVWVSNYPYSFGHPYSCGVSPTLTLSRPTKWKLKNYVERKSVLAALERVKQQGHKA